MPFASGFFAEELPAYDTLSVGSAALGLGYLLGGGRETGKASGRRLAGDSVLTVLTAASAYVVGRVARVLLDPAKEPVRKSLERLLFP